MTDYNSTPASNTQHRVNAKVSQAHIILNLNQHFVSILGPQPSRLKVIERAKYDEWKKLGSTMTKDEAKLKFIELLKSKMPKFEPKL